MTFAHGVTRNVVLTRRLAIKFPRMFVRGWLANRSEWKQRRRPGVNRPVLTFGHIIAVYRRTPWVTYDYTPPDATGLNADELKPSSWGAFLDGRGWVLIDYDRAWEHPRGLIGRLYYANQDRLARKWGALPKDLDPVRCCL